ncbi:MAG: hypothetical protein WC956_01245 [bacterium]
MLSIVIVISFLATPAGTKEKQLHQTVNQRDLRAVKITPSNMIKFDLNDSKPELNYADEFLRGLMHQQVAEDVIFEITNKGFKWKVKW